MTRLSGPVMLVIVVAGGWAVARATYVGWSNALDEEGTERLLPGLMLPLDTFTPLASGLAQGTVMASRDARATAPRAVALHQTFMAHNPVDQAQPPEPEREGERAAGVDSLYVRQQLALLSDIVNPRRSANTSLFRTSTLPNTGFTATAPSLGPLPAHISIARPPDRWSMAAWAFFRSGRAARTLGVQPQYGGSQAGARLSYRLDGAGRAALFARLSATPHGVDSAEGAIGLALRPVRSIPILVMVERRARLSGVDGRSAFAAYVVGGVSGVPLAAGFRLDAYGAAGVVGARRRDAFAEGQARLTHDVGRAGLVGFSAGAGAWGGAQAGVSRADMGPTLVVNFGDVHKAQRHVALDYRLRVAGNGAPGPGLALTLAADF